jgi:hypothetical protein
MTPDDDDELEEDSFLDGGDDDGEGAHTVVTIEIGGLSLYTHLGVT